MFCQNHCPRSLLIRKKKHSNKQMPFIVRANPQVGAQLYRDARFIVVVSADYHSSTRVLNKRAYTVTT